MTGITWLAFDLVGKRLEMLRQAAPKVSRVAVLANLAHRGEPRELAETEQAARAVGASVQYHQISAVTGRARPHHRPVPAAAGGSGH